MLDALVEELQQSRTAQDVGRVMLEATRREIGHSGLSFLRVSGPVITTADVFALTERHSPPRAAELLLEMMPHADRELKASSAVFNRASFDISSYFDPAIVSRSHVFNEYWRPLRMERQLVGCFGSLPGPVGFLCIVRSANEPSFTPADLNVFERFRATVDDSLLSSWHLGHGNLAETLSVLACATPAAWVLFDASGKLLWLSDEALARLSIDAWRFGSSTAIRNSQVLDRLRVSVRAEAKKSGPGRSRSSLLIAGSSEQFVLRRFELTRNRPVFLVGFRGHTHPGRGTPRNTSEHEVALRLARLTREYRLTPRQSTVLAEVAQGKANKTIAADLGCAESTIEFHVTRIFSSLGCENRAQLVARFWSS